MKKEILRGISLVLIVYVLFCLTPFVIQRNIIYHPSAIWKTHKQLYNLPVGYEPWLRQGQLIGYKHLIGSTNCLFFMHGNGGNARGWSFATVAFPGDVYVLEFPGYGERKGRPTEQSLKKAALEAFDCIPAYTNMVVCGQSLGTGITPAIFLNRAFKVTSLVLITPFTSLEAVGSDHFPFIPIHWLMIDKMPLYESWKSFTGSRAVVLAGNDEVIPPSAQAPFRNSNDGVMVITVQGATHNSIRLDAKAWKAVSRRSL